MNYENLTIEQKNFIRNTTQKLGKKYPIEFAYGSKAGLWGQAIRDKKVTSEQYNLARIYYGNLWNYTGD